MATLYAHAPALEHDFPRHPENAQRGPAVLNFLESRGLLDDLLIIDPVAVERERIAAVHHPRMISFIQELCLQGGGRVDQDTYATADSYRLALQASGAVCQAVDKILEGEADNGYVFIRPPGHHAGKNRPGGFCLFNHIAVGARHTHQHHGLTRVAIVDFDVHHGNGTQDIFYEDGEVLFISSHQFGSFFYPGTGLASEIGSGPGQGMTMNLPLMPGVGDEGLILLYEELVKPKIEQFNPEMILVSAGFDAHWIDPLAQINLSLTGFAALSRLLIDLSDRVCGGRILFVQEGGYVLEALSHGVGNTIYGLLGRDLVLDPLGMVNTPEPELSKLMTTVRGLHLI